MVSKPLPWSLRVNRRWAAALWASNASAWAFFCLKHEPLNVAAWFVAISAALAAICFAITGT